MARSRGVRRRIKSPDLGDGRARPPLRVFTVLKWAEAHHKRTGLWPKFSSGRIRGGGGTTWNAVQQALVKGLRGLPGGDSLPRFLARHFGVRNRSSLPKLSKEKVLSWADCYHRRTCTWPHAESGQIFEAPGETWNAVHKALLKGTRGLPGRISLPQFLAEHRGVKNHMRLPHFNQKRILSWADTHHLKTGTWPTVWSGTVGNLSSDTWRAVDQALYKGGRGLAGGTTLAELLAKYRNKWVRQYPPPLSESKVIRWAKDYYRRNGRWPNRQSGPIPKAPGETWWSVETAFKRGIRGLPRSSIYRFLVQRFSISRRADHPRSHRNERSALTNRA